MVTRRNYAKSLCGTTSNDRDDATDGILRDILIFKKIVVNGNKVTTIIII